MYCGPLTSNFKLELSDLPSMLSRLATHQACLDTSKGKLRELWLLGVLPGHLQPLQLAGMSVLRETTNEQAPPVKMAKPEITTLRVKKLSEHAVLPKRGSAKAAGYDLAR